MGEIRTIIDNRSFSYSGLISVQGLYRVLRDFLEAHAYTPYESDHYEEILESGKQIIIVLRGDKKISDFAKMPWKTTITFLNCKETIVEKENQQIKMYKGSVSLVTKVFLNTDYNKSFEQNAFQYFLRVVIDKYIFKSYLSRAIGVTQKDYNLFESTAKSFLNMEQFR